jgi:predicted DNA-binding protein
VSDTLTVRWGQGSIDLAARLKKVSAQTRRPLSDYVRAGIESNIDDWEREAEALRVLQALREGKETTTSSDTLRKRFGWPEPSETRKAELLGMIE